MPLYARKTKLADIDLHPFTILLPLITWPLFIGHTHSFKRESSQRNFLAFFSVSNFSLKVPENEIEEEQLTAAVIVRNVVKKAALKQRESLH